MTNADGADTTGAGPGEPENDPPDDHAPEDHGPGDHAPGDGGADDGGADDHAPGDGGASGRPGGLEGVADPRMEARGELSMARVALDEGDTRHAADHVARALVRDPALPEAHELLARLGNPELFPLEPTAFLGAVVARAHLLAARGDRSEALGLLVSAQCHAPDGAWAAVPWVLDPGLPARLPPGEVARCARQLLGVMGDPVPDDERPPLEPYLALVRGALAEHPGDAELLWSASIFVRRMGDADAAADLAVRSERARPSFQAALALGHAHRSRDRWDDAERAWLRALEHDPGNLALHTDLGELLAAAGRLDEGLAWVEKALEADPDDESAFPTACGMRFERDGDVAHLVALADYLRGHPGNAHADDVLTRCSQSRYWLGPVPEPSEAVINVLRQVLARGDAEDASGEVSLSAPEPPSALHALGRALPGLTVTITEVPEPDARADVPDLFSGGPVSEVAWRVWRRDGSPANKPPSAETANALRALAARRWRHLPAAYDDAVRLSAAPLDDLLGALAHPPEPPEPYEARIWPDWVRSVQAWACLGIAHQRPDQPWEGSARRAVLADLAYGPEDWVSEAALLALVAAAWTDPAAREDVTELVAWRFVAALNAARTRAVTIAESLALLARATPGMHPEVDGLARDYLTPPEPEPEPEPEAEAAPAPAPEEPPRRRRLRGRR